ncbi:MAG TPA: hypothetical protein VII40_18205 [Xanthobacteraceae bacterium]|jgi:hypothetical protein
MSDIADLIDRAAQDPEFLSGIVPSDQLNAVLGTTDAREIAETLRARIAHAHNGKK